MSTCIDCHANVHDLKEYDYIVVADIWHKVCPGGEGMLCIGCLEKRLNRELTFADFDVEIPLNHFANDQSERLRNRLIGLDDLGVDWVHYQKVIYAMEDNHYWGMPKEFLPVDPNLELMLAEDFCIDFACDGIADADGYGKLATATAESDIIIKPSQTMEHDLPCWATHVVWYENTLPAEQKG